MLAQPACVAQPSETCRATSHAMGGISGSGKLKLSSHSAHDLLGFDARTESKQTSKRSREVDIPQFVFAKTHHGKLVARE